MKRISTAILLMTTLSGCSAIFDGVIEYEMELRNTILSQKAWGHWSWCYDDLDYPFHFAKGFKAGYRNILDGGNGCQPTLPPRCYWKPSHQTPEGHCKVHAWFDGFSHGVLAAKQDGYGAMGEIPISPTARQNLTLNRTPRPDNMYYATESGMEPEAVPGVPDGVGVMPGTEGILEPTLPTTGENTGELTPVRPYE